MFIENNESGNGYFDYSTLSGGKSVSSIQSFHSTPFSINPLVEALTTGRNLGEVMGANYRVLEDDSSDTEPESCDLPTPKALKKVWGGDIPDHLIKMFSEGSKYLNGKQQLRLAEILSKYREVFVRSSTELGLSKVGEHKIETGDHNPV